MNIFFPQGNVVCKQLGYHLGAESVTGKSYYGSVPDIFAYDEVRCVGTEETLDECNHENSDNCDGTEGAGVVCGKT